MGLHPRPPFGLSQDVIGNMFLLQRRDIEHAGFFKGTSIFNIRTGLNDAVDSDIQVDENVDGEFHTHPTNLPSWRDYGNRKVSNREYKCAKELAILESVPIGGYDAFWALQYRKKDVPSFMVSERLITRYQLDDEQKWNAWKKVVKDRYGEVNEKSLAQSFEDESSRIQGKITTKIHEKDQDFSICGDRDAWINGNKKWYELLRGAGLKIDAMPAKMPRSFSRSKHHVTGGFGMRSR